MNRIANFGLADTNLLNLVIQARIAAAMAAPLDRMESFAPCSTTRRARNTASTSTSWTRPSRPTPPRSPGWASASPRGLVYLNEGYEGGATEFPLLGLGHRARGGDALLFVSADAAGTPDPRTVHAGRAPTSGEKWLLSPSSSAIAPVIGVAPRTR
ncbi:MAG: hypothetical protein WDM92_14240 [Caulobacteraceae bacterium]